MVIFFSISALMLTAICMENRLHKYFLSVEESMSMDVRIELKGGQINQIPGVACLQQREAEEVQRLSQVEGVSYTCITQADGEGIVPIKKSDIVEGEEEDFLSDFLIVGMSDLAAYGDIKSGEITLLEGRFPDSENGACEAVISKVLAEQNGIGTGDTIPIKGISDNARAEVFKVVGIHSGEYMFTTPVWADPTNKIFVSLESALRIQGKAAYREAVYTLKSAAELEAFLENAKTIVGKTDTLDYIPMKLGYSSMKYTAENIQTFIHIIVVTILIFGSIVVGIVLVDYVNKNKRYIGTLLALGEKKVNILAQYFLEVMFPLALGTALSIVIFRLGIVLADSIMKQKSMFWSSTASTFVNIRQLCGVIGVNVGVVCIFCILAFVQIQCTTVWRLLEMDRDN